MFEFFNITNDADDTGLFYLAPLSAANNGKYLVCSLSRERLLRLRGEIASGRMPSPNKGVDAYRLINTVGGTEVYELTN